MGLGPDVAVGTEALLLVLQVEGRHRRMVAALLSDVARAAFRCVHHTGEGLANDGIVGLLATLQVKKRREKYVGFVMPTG